MISRIVIRARAAMSQLIDGYWRQRCDALRRDVEALDEQLGVALRGEREALEGQRRAEERCLVLARNQVTPEWLGDAADALGAVRKEDGAPLVLSLTHLLEVARELREERDDWKGEAERAQKRIAGFEDEASWGPYAGPRSEIETAIRVFTYDPKDAAGEPVPNGRTERAVDRLGDLLLDAGIHVESPIGATYSEMLESMADDCQRLREAAEVYFGGDFKGVPPGEHSEPWRLEKREEGW